MRRQKLYLPNKVVGHRGYRPKEALIQFPTLYLPGPNPLPSSRGMPGRPCCCYDGPLCTACASGYSGFDEVSVELPTLTNSDCSDCDSYSSNIFVVPVLSIAGFVCDYVLNPIPDDPCSAFKLSVTFQKSGSTYYIDVGLYFTYGYMIWRKSYGTAPQCTAFSNEEIPWSLSVNSPHCTNPSDYSAYITV